MIIGTRTFVTVALIGLALIGIAGCSPSDNTTETVTYNADYPAFDDLDDLTNSADVVVTGVVIGSETRIIYPEQSSSTDPLENPFAGASEEDAAAAQAEAGVVTTVSTL